MKVIAISGASATGKTNLLEIMSTHGECSNVVFGPDLFNTVWGSLVSQGIFNSYDEIIKDSEFICVYLFKVLDYYKDYLSMFEDTDSLVVLDCCWLDLLAYALLNMWCTRPIKSLQEEIIGKILELRDSVDKIYLTKFDKRLQDNKKFRNEFQIYSVKDNRSLELKYYDVFSLFSHVEALPTSNPDEASLFIIEDLKKLGYL